MNKRDIKAVDRNPIQRFTQQDFKQELFGPSTIQNPSNLMNFQHPDLPQNDYAQVSNPEMEKFPKTEDVPQDEVG